MTLEIHTKEQGLLHFFQRIGDAEECWLWSGAKNDKGYGQISIEGKVLYAHRVAYELVYGPVDDDLEICHHCDNSSCVRPNHLFIGTHHDNMVDAGRKGHMRRNMQGSRHPATRLTEDDIRQIRKRYAVGGITYSKLALDYDVGWTTIQKIITRKSWQHI